MERMENFFIQPDSLEEAKELLGTLPENFTVLAGGTDLLISVRKKRQEGRGYFSLWRIPELRKIEQNGDWIKIGAMVTHTQASEDEMIREKFRALGMACSRVGSCQIRNKGTLGGNIVNGSPAGDILPCICLFDGELEFLSSRGFRRESVFDFLKKRKEERVGRQEILSAVYLPLDNTRRWDSCFLKLGERDEVTIAQISLCARWYWEGEEKKEVEAYMGAVDTKPVPCSCPQLLEGRLVEEDRAEKLAKILREQILELKKKRTRQSKLKITDAEKQYKERAVKGLLYDLIDEMNQRRG